MNELDEFLANCGKFRKDDSFKIYLTGLSDILYEKGWFTAALYIKECKNIEECRICILNHCGEEYLYLL